MVLKFIYNSFIDVTSKKRSGKFENCKFNHSSYGFIVKSLFAWISLRTVQYFISNKIA